MSSSTRTTLGTASLGAVLGLTATAVTALALTLPTGATATASEPGDPTATPTSEPTDQPTEPTSETTQEKGVLIECAGTWKGQPATVSVHENRTYGNELVVGETCLRVRTIPARSTKGPSPRSWGRARPVACYSANASSGGHEHCRLRSP